MFSQNKYLKFSDTEILVSKNDFCYLKITASEINLFGIDVFSKLKNDNKSNRDSFDSYFEFISRIKNNNIRLNHLGFGYRINNLEAELNNFRNHLWNDFELVEEESYDAENNRWFFIKHKIDQSAPKIELVFYLTDKYKEYYPQFQLDIDTNLSFESIKKTTDKLFGKDFFFWKYDVPDYGIVMAMGTIGQINRVNILVGIGTNLRKPQTFKT